MGRLAERGDALKDIVVRECCYWAYLSLCIILAEKRLKLGRSRRIKQVKTLWSSSIARGEAFIDA